MNDSILIALRIAEGPVLRFALALAVLVSARNIVLTISDMTAAYLTTQQRGAWRRKLQLQVIWFVFPTLILHRAGFVRTGGQFLYHTFFSCVSLVFRTCAILVPTFMVAHVYLWERALGVAWPAFPGELADTLTYVTIISGMALFLGRLYSSAVRRLDPPWAFFKPLIMLMPFVTGLLAMHPTWSPVDYHAIMLAHVLSASFVIAILPFARFFRLHARLAEVLPDAAWDYVESGGVNEVQRAMAAELELTAR